ncbi:MAG: STAS-like domain-containing protein [Rhodospirillaceae bacterium]|nr:STAS-like domain-containing protein [Rhodospirillaceae bacterium]
MSTAINIAQEFSRTPAGRFISDGPYSGESFREKYLVPALRANNTVTVELDGGAGYGSSFLEEVFGGLVRKGYFTIDEVRERLKVVSEDDTLIDEVWEYVNQTEIENHH